MVPCKGCHQSSFYDFARSHIKYYLKLKIVTYKLIYRPDTSDYGVLKSLIGKDRDIRRYQLFLKSHKDFIGRLFDDLDSANILIFHFEQVHSHPILFFDKNFILCIFPGAISYQVLRYNQQLDSEMELFDNLRFSHVNGEKQIRMEEFSLGSARNYKYVLEFAMAARQHHDESTTPTTSPGRQLSSPHGSENPPSVLGAEQSIQSSPHDNTPTRVTTSTPTPNRGNNVSIIASTQSKIGHLEEEALKQREKLRELKRKREDSSETNAQSKLLDADGLPLPKPQFRSYKPSNEQLHEFVLDPTQPGDVTSEVKNQLESVKSEMVIDQLDVTSLAPRKPDWDLKRQVIKKLEKLEREIQKAIAELK